MRILVTGAAGFVGGHLVELLLAGDGAEVHGVARRTDWPPELAHLADRVRLHEIDLTDRSRVEAVLRAVKPERVYHLAGYALAGQSFHEPEAAWAGNLSATRTLFDAMAVWSCSPRILAVTSGMIYGANERADIPCDESSPLRPTSPYAS